MESIMKTDLFLCFPAYLQFYYYDNKNITYEKIYDIMLQNLKKDEEFFNKIKNSILDLNSEETQSYQNFKDRFPNFPISEIKSRLHDFLKEITYVSDSHLNFLLNTYNKNQKFIFYNDNPLHLLLDEIIVTNFKNREIIHKENIFFYTSWELLEIISFDCSPKSYVIMNQKISTLLPFHTLGCWTILLTPIVYSYFDIKDESEIKSNEILDTVEKNCDYLKTDDKFFSFSTTNFFQLAFYYNEIIQINKLDDGVESICKMANRKKLLDKIQNEFQPLRVLIFLRTLMRNQSFKKQRFFISDKNIIYYSHVGGEDISLNHEKFDFIIAKAIELKDSISYAKVFDNLISYSLANNVKMINDLRNLKWFVEKDLMSDFLINFVNSKEIQNIVNKYNIQLKFPQNFTLQLKDLLNREKFLNYLNENKIEFPLIIKYKGHSNFFKHLISFVFEEKFLDNYIEFLNEIKIPEVGKIFSETLWDTKCIIQNFVNHGGNVLKFYRLNKQNFLDFRSSLPDLNEDFQSRHVNGVWNFKTIELETEEFKNIWKVYHGDNRVEKIIKEEDGKKFKFLCEIVEEFEKFSKFTLFGLDFLYDVENHKKGEDIFYIVDCNSLPSYKIKNIDTSEYFTKHFINYAQKKN